MCENLEISLNGIVEGYFENKSITELIQGAKDVIVVDNFKIQLENFRGRVDCLQ